MAQADFLDKQSLMEGQSHNVLAALTVLNGTAAGLHDHLEYFRAMSDEYLGVRTNGLLALVAFATAAGALGLLGVTAGLTESKTFAPCKCPSLGFLDVAVCLGGIPTPDCACVTWMCDNS